MLEDAVIKELHEIRELHAKHFNYDVTAIVADLKAQEASLAHRLVQRPINRRKDVIPKSLLLEQMGMDS